MTVSVYFEEREMDQIKNLVFDLGDVLIQFRWRDFLRNLGVKEEDVERVGAEMFDDPKHLWHEFDLGNLSAQQAAKELGEEYPEDAEVISWFILHGEYMPLPRLRVWEMVHLLKLQGYRIYVLSNYPEELFHKHTQYADFMQDLDGRVISYEVHMGKPELPIYRELLARYQLIPQECLFFDDRKENILGARACGMYGRQVFSQEGLLEDLGKIHQGRVEEVLRTD